jgi:hypothetical protein
MQPRMRHHRDADTTSATRLQLRSLCELWSAARRNGSRSRAHLWPGSATSRGRLIGCHDGEHSLCPATASGVPEALMTGAVA